MATRRVDRILDEVPEVVQTSPCRRLRDSTVTCQTADVRCRRVCDYEVIRTARDKPHQYHRDSEVTRTTRDAQCRHHCDYKVATDPTRDAPCRHHCDYKVATDPTRDAPCRHHCDYKVVTDPTRDIPCHYRRDYEVTRSTCDTRCWHWIYQARDWDGHWFRSVLHFWVQPATRAGSDKGDTRQTDKCSLVNNLAVASNQGNCATEHAPHCRDSPSKFSSTRRTFLAVAVDSKASTPCSKISVAHTFSSPISENRPLADRSQIGAFPICSEVSKTVFEPGPLPSNGITGVSYAAAAEADDTPASNYSRVNRPDRCRPTSVPDPAQPHPVKRVDLQAELSLSVQPGSVACDHSCVAGDATVEKCLVHNVSRAARPFLSSLHFQVPSQLFTPGQTSAVGGTHYPLCAPDLGKSSSCSSEGCVGQLQQRRHRARHNENSCRLLNRTSSSKLTGATPSDLIDFICDLDTSTTASSVVKEIVKVVDLDSSVECETQWTARQNVLVAAKSFKQCCTRFEPCFKSMIPVSVTESVAIVTLPRFAERSFESTVTYSDMRRHKVKVNFEPCLAAVRFGETMIVYGKNSTRKRYVSRTYYEPRVKPKQFAETDFVYPKDQQQTFASFLDYHIDECRKWFKTCVELKAKTFTTVQVLADHSSLSNTMVRSTTQQSGGGGISSGCETDLYDGPGASQVFIPPRKEETLALAEHKFRVPLRKGGKMDINMNESLSNGF